MHILLLAPHPFYQERGTPIAVDLLASALSERGDDVDILAYHEGENRTYSGSGKVTIHRITPLFPVHNLRPGFSLKKLVCDAAMYRKASRMAHAKSYDCIHAVEESAFMARRIGAHLGIPYIFDMDSSMPQQIADKLPIAKPLLPIMHKFEAGIIKSAAAVVPMCKALADTARSLGAAHIEILHDISLLPEKYTPCPENGFRKALRLSGPVLLYIGNLEPYQGIDLLLESFAITAKQKEDADLVIVGGREDDIRKYKTKADDLKIGARVHFTGPRPLSHMPDLFNDADILVSPRIQGENTPMKIYSYLDAERAVLATDLPTHTQVMNSDAAELVAPQPQAMAAGMLKLLQDDSLRSELGKKSKRLAQERYSMTAFKTVVNRLYNYVESLSAVRHKTVSSHGGSSE